MKDRYQLVLEFSNEWISRPNNGGEVGDMSDIVEELNRLYYKVQDYEKELDKLKNSD